MSLQKVLIVGGGIGGTAILKLLLSAEFFEVEAIIDIDKHASALEIAKQHQITVDDDWRKYINNDLHMIFDLTGQTEVYQALLKAKQDHVVLIPGSVANMLVRLLTEKDTLLQLTKEHAHQQQLIFNSIDEGMVGVDKNSIINFFNKSAARMTDVAVEDAVGKHIYEVIPTSALPRIFESGRTELNKELVLSNGAKIVTSRFPVVNEQGERIGAFSIFKDITEVVNLAEEITNLKEIQTMLQAIIQSSDDAISVVDEDGKGLLINPAYTRITGLETEDIIGKPATADISEGESMHLKVLQTRKAIRGVNMRVGPAKREVIVNVAPIISSVGTEYGFGLTKGETGREVPICRFIVNPLHVKGTSGPLRMLITVPALEYTL
jgi:PAS domain S-box-containing protein